MADTSLFVLIYLVESGLISAFWFLFDPFPCNTRRDAALCHIKSYLSTFSGHVLDLGGFWFTSGCRDFKVMKNPPQLHPPLFNWFFHTSLTNYRQNTNQSKIAGASWPKDVAVYKGWQLWPRSIQPLSPAPSGFTAGLSAVWPSGLIKLQSLASFSDPHVRIGACC